MDFFRYGCYKLCLSSREGNTDRITMLEQYKNPREFKKQREVKKSPYK